MIPLDVTLDLSTHPWTDVHGAHLGTVVRAGLMPAGTGNSRPVVCFLVVLDDGTRAVVTTTYRLFRTMAQCFAASAIGLVAEQEDGP